MSNKQLKLQEVFRTQKGDFDSDQQLIYVGRFKGSTLDELVDEAEKKGLESEFYSMPFLPHDYYVTEETFNKFNNNNA
jgi:hypothetical protein